MSISCEKITEITYKIKFIFNNCSFEIDINKNMYPQIFEGDSLKMEVAKEDILDLLNLKL